MVGVVLWVVVFWVMALWVMGLWVMGLWVWYGGYQCSIWVAVYFR